MDLDLDKIEAQVDALYNYDEKSIKLIPLSLVNKDEQEQLSKIFCKNIRKIAKTLGLKEHVSMTMVKKRIRELRYEQRIRKNYSLSQLRMIRAEVSTIETSRKAVNHLMGQSEMSPIQGKALLSDLDSRLDKLLPKDKMSLKERIRLLNHMIEVLEKNK